MVASKLHALQPSAPDATCFGKGTHTYSRTASCKARLSIWCAMQGQQGGESPSTAAMAGSGSALRSQCRGWSACLHHCRASTRPSRSSWWPWPPPAAGVRSCRWAAGALQVVSCLRVVLHDVPSRLNPMMHRTCVSTCAMPQAVPVIHHSASICRACCNQLACN